MAAIEPKQLPESSGELSALHMRLDKSIRNNGHTAWDAKQLKLRVKQTLLDRAHQGCDVARRYAIRRRWLGAVNY